MDAIVRIMLTAVVATFLIAYIVDERRKTPEQRAADRAARARKPLSVAGHRGPAGTSCATCGCTSFRRGFNRTTVCVGCGRRYLRG